MKSIAYALLFCTLACACGAPIKQDVWVEFALSSPNHLSDWQDVRTALQNAGIDCQDGASDVGTLSFSVASGNFDHAKEIAVRLISSKSLNLRVKKQKTSTVFDVYQNGKKVAEWSYSVQ